MPSRNRRIAIAGGTVALLLVVAVVVLLFVSNTIIKGQIERLLGGKSTVERVALGWNKVEITGLNLFPGKPTSMSVERVDIRASFLTLLGKRYSLSRVTLHRPSVKLHIDDKGNVDNPFAAESKEPEKKGASSSALPPIHLGKVVLDNGSVTITDDTFPKPGNVINLTGIELQIENLSFPKMDSASKISLKTAISGKLLSGQVACKGKINLGNQSGELQVETKDIQVIDDGRGPRAKAKAMRCNASFGAAQPKGRAIALTNVQLDAPFIRLEEERSGRFVNPFSFGKAETTEKKQSEPTIITLKNVKVTDGELLYLDGKVATPPHPLQIRNIATTLDALTLPFDNRRTTWQMTAQIPGKTVVGGLQGSGETNFLNLDTKGRFTLRSLDLLAIKPYIVKKGEADVVGGSLDMDVNMSIRNRSIYAPTHAVIRNLEFAPGKGASDVFLGIPRSLIIKLLETSRNELPLDFVVEGNLDNPKFSLQESFVRRFAVSIGRKLGISVIETGQNVMTQGGKILKGIGSGLRGLFK